MRVHFRRVMQLFWLLIFFSPCLMAKQNAQKLKKTTRLRQLFPNAAPVGESRIAMVNTEKPAHILSENFISLTLDPYMIRDLPWADPHTLILAKELSPAWFKIAPTTEIYEYGDFNLTMFQWAAVSHFANESGLIQLWDVGIFARAAENWKKMMRGDEFEESEAAHGTLHEFPPPIEHIGFVAAASDLEKTDAIKRVFSRYNSSSLQVFGPEVAFFNTYNEIEKFSDWLANNSDKVSAVTFRPSPKIGGEHFKVDSILTKEPSDLFKLELMVLQGTLEQMRQKNKPIIISDSRMRWEKLATTQKFRNTFGETLLWADRLGLAAANGVRAVFQPDLLPMHERGVRNQPSPDYWFALLHKKLAGNRVLSIRSRASENSLSSLYSHCTPDWKDNYEPGAVTIFGINLGGVELRGNVSDWSRDGEETILHQYVLTGDVNEKRVLLNGIELKSDFETNPIPKISAIVLKSPKALIMPPHSITFWVFPDVVAPACLDHEQHRRKRSILDDDPDTTHLAIVFPVEDVRAAEEAMEQERKPALSKTKRCPQLLHRKRLGGNAEESCPEGCSPTNPLGGCRYRGMKIMAPGCSTSQVLERMVYIANQRKNGCCCDGKGSCGDETSPIEEGKREDGEGKPVVIEGASTTAPQDDNLIDKIFTSPPPLEKTTPDLKTPTPHQVEYSPPLTTPVEMSTQSQALQSSRKFTYYYDKKIKKFVTTYVTVSTTTPTPQTTTTPTTESTNNARENENEGKKVLVEKSTPIITQITTTSSPQTTTTLQSTTILTTEATKGARENEGGGAKVLVETSTPVVPQTTTNSIPQTTTTLIPHSTTTLIPQSTTTPKTEAAKNARENENGGAPLVEKFSPGLPPPYGPNPFRFEGHFNGLIHPYDQQTELTAGEEFLPRLHRLAAYPSLSPLNEAGAVRNRQEQFSSNFKTHPSHPGTASLRRNFYYPAEAAPLSRRAVVPGDKEQGFERDLDESQKLLTKLQDKLATESSTSGELGDDGCQGGCDQSDSDADQLKSKIKTALQVLNWLKESNRENI